MRQILRQKFPLCSNSCKLYLRISVNYASEFWKILKLLYMQGVTGGTDQTSGECSLSQTTDITQNTYIQSSMVTEVLAREVSNFDSYYSLIYYQMHIETGRNMWFL